MISPRALKRQQRKFLDWLDREITTLETNNHVWNKHSVLSIVRRKYMEMYGLK